MLKLDITNPIHLASFSAFAGAFTSFLFVQLGDFFGRIHKRKITHLNSLVVLETELNEIGGMLNDNIYLMPYFRSAILRGKIYFSQLSQLPIDKSHYEKLYDISLINDLYSYYYQLRKLNDDISGLMGGYKDIKNAYIQHDISPEDYLINAKITSDMIITLEVFAKDMEQKTVDLMAKVRLMAEKDVPWITRITRWFIKTSGSEITKEEIMKESKKLLAEIEDTKARSRKEIDKLIVKKGNS